MTRRAFLDRSPGEARGVVTVHGRPERLLIERDGDFACQRLGARALARVRSVDRGLGMAFLALPEGPDATATAGRLAEGQIVEVEIAAEPRADKGAVVTVIGAGEGALRLLTAAPSLVSRLAAWAGAEPLEGSEARRVADLAEDQALQTVHPLPGGGHIAIEATRALVAVDVDLAGRKGGDSRRLARQANLEAMIEAARLLRLKSLGGLIVVDLVGKGHDGVALSAAAKAAFAPDEPGVSVGPISRFGLFELAIPHRLQPRTEVLEPTPSTAALRLLRALEDAALADPGGRVSGRCSPVVAALARPYMPVLTDRFGERLELTAEANHSDLGFEIR